MVAEQVRNESSDEEFQHLLQEGIAEALEPVLVTVRRELSDAVREGAARVGDSREIEPGLEVERVPVAAPSGAAPPAQPVSGPATQPQREDGTPEEPADALRPAMAAVLHALAERAERGLGSLLERVLAQAVSGAVRDALRTHAHGALSSLVEEAFAAVPDSIATQELRQTTTDALQDVLDDMIESVVAGPMGSDLTTHGEAVLEALMRRDFAAAGEHLERALSETLHDALALLRPHWARILRLVLPVIVKAGAGAMASTVKEGAQELVSGDDKPTEERKHEPRREAPKRRRARDDDLRTLFSETTDTLRREMEAEVETVNQRLKDGLTSAAKKGMRNQHLGRPPSVRRQPPAAGGRATSHRRSPHGRHPSAR